MEKETPNPAGLHIVPEKPEEPAATPHKDPFRHPKDHSFTAGLERINSKAKKNPDKDIQK